MYKFFRLENFLNEHIFDEPFSLSFDDIERILGFKLSDSAYKYAAYWSPSETHTLANMISNCGYTVTPNLTKLTVDFIHKNAILSKNKKIKKKYFFKSRFILDGHEYGIIRNPYTNGPMITDSEGSEKINRKDICRKFLKYYGWTNAMFEGKVTNYLERQVEKILDKNDMKIIIASNNLEIDDNKSKEDITTLNLEKEDNYNIKITNQMIDEAHEKVRATDNYGQEDFLITSSFKRFPNNTEVEIVVMKVGLIDITNSTHISQHKSKISAVELAEAIVKIENIDERIKNGDPEVVNEIAKCNGKINLFSFASKYCCYHNKNVYGKDDYSILDTVVKESLPKYFKDITKSQIQKWQDNYDYKSYNDYITKKLDELNITVPFRKRKFDHFIWFNNRKKIK